MAEPRPPAPVLLIAAVFGRQPDALSWAKTRLEAEYGPVDKASAAFPFNQTDYYAEAMGTDLRKQFLAFRDLIAPDRLAEIKLHTNALERELAESGRCAEQRPINIDPGYLNLGKFLLATTKDQAHRIYLRDGVYAEVTLRFHDGAFEPWPWTYADYRESGYHEFLQQARVFFRGQLEKFRQERIRPGGQN